jgi:hypothetical protein
MLYVASALIEHHHTAIPSNAHSDKRGDASILAVATATGVGQGTSSDAVAIGDNRVDGLRFLS